MNEEGKAVRGGGTEPLLRVSQVAGTIRASMITVYRLIEAGDIEAERRNDGTIHVPESRLLAFLEGNTLGGTYDDSGFLLAAEVADLWRVTRQTVYARIHAGDLKVLRINRGFRVYVSSVKEKTR